MVEQLQKDMIEALKNKEKERLTVIRMVKAALDKERIDKKVEITDDLLVDVVNKQIKMRNDSITEFKKANRLDLVTKTEEEIEVLKKYLPEQLSIEEVDKIIDEVFEIVKPESQKDFGKIMKEIMPKVKGKADMKLISDKIKEKLN